MFKFLLTTGIANVRIPSFFRTRYDSEIKLFNGLKCCADSSAIILSTEFVEKVGLELNLAATGEKEIEKAMNAANKANRKLLVKDGKLSN